MADDEYQIKLDLTKQRLKICQFLFNREKTFHFTIDDLRKF